MEVTFVFLFKLCSSSGDIIGTKKKKKVLPKERCQYQRSECLMVEFQAQVFMGVLLIWILLYMPASKAVLDGDRLKQEGILPGPQRQLAP